MRKLHLLTVILIFLTPAVTPNRSYSTRFQFDEDPIAEGGKWINGGKVGLDRFNVATKTGHITT